MKNPPMLGSEERHDGATHDEKDLLCLLPDEIANHPACFDSKRYREWEDEIAYPALLNRGYVATNWRTTDGDSFGPLVRAVDLTKNGKTETYYYG